MAVNYVWDEKKQRYVAKNSGGANNASPSGGNVSARVAANRKANAEDVEWQERLRLASVRAAQQDIFDVERFDNYRARLEDGLYKRGASDTFSRMAGNLSQYQNSYQAIVDNIDMFDLNDDERDEMLKAAESNLSIINQYRDIARARSGDKSVLNGATGDVYDEYSRLLNLAGYDTATGKLNTQLPQQIQQPKQQAAPIDIPADYDFNTFGDDIYRAKYGEEKDGTKLTEDQRQQYKRRVEMMTGIEDFDKLSTREQLNLTYDENYLAQLQKMNKGVSTYHDVLDVTGAYTDEDRAYDAMVLQDAAEGHVNASEDDVNRAKNRLSAMGDLTGVDMEGLLGLDGYATSLNDYVKTMNAYAAQARGDAEQAKFDDEISQKYGQYRSVADFKTKAQPISLDANPTNEAEMVHEAIVAIDNLEVFDRLLRQYSENGMPPAAMRKYTANTTTAEQRQMFNYLWNTHGQDAAMEYLNDIEWSVNKLTAAKTEEVTERLSEGVVGGAAASIASVLASPARAAVLPFNTARAAMGEEINQYDPTFNVGRAYDTARENVGENIDEALGGANILGWDIGSGIYNGVMSVADNLMLAGLGAGAGSVVMGLEAGDTAMREALANGRSTGEAVRDAYVTAGVEAATEKVPMEKLFGDVGNPVKYIISNALSEAGEEVTSEMLNLIYDQVMYGEDSDLGKLADELRMMGYAGDDLTKEVLKSIVGRVRDAAFGGIAGGALGTAPRAAATYAADKKAGKNLQSNDAVKSMLDLADKVLPEGEIRKIAQEQLAAVEGGKGKVSDAKIGRVYREMMQAVDERAQSAIQTTAVRYINDLLEARGKKSSELAQAISRIVADNGSATPEDYKMVAKDDDALAVTEGLVKAYDKDMDIAMQAEDVAIKATTRTQNASAQAVESDVENGNIDAEVALQAVREAAAELGGNAESMVSAYNEGQDPAVYAEQFKRAYQYGEAGYNLGVISKSQNLSGLTEYQIQKAYTMGKGVREGRNNQAAQRPKDNAQVGNVDTSKLVGIRLNKAQAASVGAIRRLAQAVGFNVEFIASKTNAAGEFTEKNGSWNPTTRTITIDINAGRVSVESSNYAIMQTAGHELTHFIREFADADLWNDYQEFVFGHLSEKMDAAKLDATIDEYIARWAQSNATLDRDGAIEEIVADASGDALLKLTDADIQQMAQQNPSLLKKIGDFIQKWASKVRGLIEKAYKGQTERNEIAEQMLDAVDELGRKWAELLKSASANAANFTVTENGAVVSPEVAEIVESDDYAAPNNGLLGDKYSIRETAAWAKSHREQYPDDAAFEQNLALVENFDRNVAADSVARYLVPHGRIPKTVRGPLRNNVEYVYTFDMDTKCERTYQFLAYRDAIQKRIGRQLTEDEARCLIEQMRAYGQMIPCTYCYVEGKRMKLAELYMKYLSKNSESVMGQKYSAEEVFDIVETARSVVSGYLDNRFNVEDNYTLDATLASGDFAGYRDFEMPISEEAAAQEIYDRYNITDKSAKRVVAGFVAEWVYSRRMDVPQNLVNADVDFDTATIDERVLAFHDLATKAAQGGAKAKGIENYEPYVDQLKNVSVEDKRYMVGMGGIRKHSSNDFQIQNVQDYMLFFMDLAADKRGGVDWTGHTYTKNLDYARIFAPTNDRINVSIAMYGDNTSGITPNTQEGVEWEELKQIRKQYKNVGAMAMVTNNDQLSFALNSSWIDMIIPFHASGMKRSLYYDVLAWTDYTSKQSERLYTKGQMIDKLREKGIKVNSSAKAADVLNMFMENFDVKVVYNEKTGKRVAPHFFPGETIQHGVKIPGHGNDAQRYFELCEQYGTNPRFFGVKVQDAGGKTIDVTQHPSYLKLIKETARTDTPQQPIVAKFDMDYVNEAMSRFRGYSNLSEDTYGIVDEFVREYAGKKRKVGYLTERAQQYKEIRAEMAAEEAAKRASQRDELIDTVNAVENEQSPSFDDDASVKFSVRVTDKKTLDFLNDQETVTTYKTMQVVDGKLYPPMAAVVAGKYEDDSKLGEWEAATERPDLIKLDKNGKPQFNLNKGKGKGSLNAAYNPYMHSSNLVLNDQFSGAYDRPNLVTVQCEVPVSELTSGYHAQYAKDSVGWHAWHTGTVAGALRRKTGIERRVLLSRWIKPVRIVPDAEVAQMYKELLDGTGIAVPDNVVPPLLLAELKKAGVEIAVSGRVPDTGEKYSVRVGTFDPENPDINYQLRDPNQITDRELLANVMDAAAANETELDFVQRYRAKINELNKKQVELDATNEAIVNARKEGKKSELGALRSKAEILGKQLDRMDGQLLKFEAGKPLQAVVMRERAKLRQKANERVQKRVAEVRQQEAERRDRIYARMDELRAEKNRKIDELRKEKTAAVKKVRDEKNESFARQKYLEEVKKSTDKLRVMVTTPTNKVHVPQVLRQPLADFLTALDFTSARQLNGGEATKADGALENAMLRMKDALTRIKNHQNGLDTTGAEYFSGYLDLPAGYSETFDEIIGKVRVAIRATDSINDIPINRMKSADLHELAKHLRMLHSAINNMNSLIANAKYASAIAASQDTIADLDKVKRTKDQNVLVQKLSDFIDWKNTVPYYAFKRFGKGGSAIFEALMDGWDKLAFNAQDLVDFTEKTYKPEEVKAWESEIKTIELESGESVHMTAAQLMSLYCLAKREQALGHLMGGGIRIADIDAKRGKRIAQGENYILSEADIETFRDALNERQRAVADVLQQDMVKRGGDWGNEISMRRFGYDMFTEQNYFPVESDRNNMNAKDENATENSLLRLLNMSATKDLTKGANNAIVIRSIFDVYTSHMSDMAKYNALGLQILDLMKWLNYVERTDELDVNGNSTGKITTQSVQKSLELAYGTEARNYIMEFIRNLNGEVEAGREDGIINKLTSNYKIAAVGANLRVGFLQITSLPRAATVIDPKYLRTGIAKWNAKGGKTSKQATDNVGIAKWKSMGFYDTNISRNMRQMIKHDEAAIDKVRNGSMILAEKGDAWTMGVLYGAVESELLQKERGLEPGTDAWNKRVNERMREIIYRTQVVDSTMTRSHLMRQRGAISGALAFMSEPTLALNMMNDALFESRMSMRRGERWNPAVAKNVAKVFAATAVVSGLAAIMEAAFSAMRDDDEFETFAEKYLKALAGDYSDAETYGEKLSAFFGSALGSKLNPVSNIPVLSDVIDAWKNGAAEQMWQAFMGETGEGIRALMKVLREGGSLADYYRAAYKTLGGISKGSGIPASNAVRDLASIYNTFAAEPMGWKRLQTYDNTESEAAAALLEAFIAGDDEKVKQIRGRTAVYGLDEEKIEKSLATRVTDAYMKGDIAKDKADKLLTEEAGKRDRAAEETLAKADYQIATGLKYSEMKDDFIDGTITEKQAKEYLKKYDGLRDEEIDEKIGMWNYEKATGLVYSEMKQDFIDGVLTESQVKSYRTKYGGDEPEDVETTLGKWKYERDTGLLYSEMKLDYEDGVISESQLRGYLEKYGGKDEEQVEDTVSNYDYYIATGRTTSAPKYWRIAYAFDSGADYGAYIDEAFNTIMYGGEKKKTWKQARSQIASSLASYYKTQYLAARGTAAGDAMLERILDLYEAIGYDREYERKYIAENW